MKNSKFTPDNPLRIAMWSGPRNISTALMRAWGNRNDTFVCDEPLYAHYLHKTGLPHPMAQEVIASQNTDWRKVVAWLTGPVPNGKSIFYQKQMSHHLLPEISRDWLPKLTHCFLIRHPAEVLPSLDEKYERPQLPDTGYPQQAEIFDQVVKTTGRISPVIDSRDILMNPPGMLSRLCAELEVDFQETMLTWAPGLRETDGVWAKHWYNAVEKTTGFQPYVPKNKPMPDHLRGLYEQCLPYYEKLYASRLTAT
jgi:hypothetical protein